MKNIFISFCLLAIVFSLPASGQLVSTIAGGGASLGDGGPATAATLALPYFIAKDGGGNVYIADYGNQRIRKVDPSGIITTIAGTGAIGYAGDGGAATAAELYNPRGIAVDNAGNIYFSDFGNHRLRKINTAGIISTIAGNGTPGFSGDGGAATLASFWYPAGISIDTAGDIYVADKWNNRIRKINTAGIVTTVAGTGPTGYMSGSHTGDGGPATAAQMNYVEDVAVDNTGNMYVCDAGNNCIRKVSASNTITNYAGNGIGAFSGDAGPATAAELSSPGGVAVDLAGNVYIGDAGNSRVRKIDHTTGFIFTICGWGVPGFFGDGGPATDAEVHGPAGIVVDCPGNVYFADNLNNRVRKIDNTNSMPWFPAGHIQTVNVCADRANSLDSMLRISDFDPGQSESWTAIAMPTNGTAVIAYSGISNGGVLLPSGLTYTPSSGYIGADSFRAAVFDCANAADTTTVHLNVISCPLQIGAPVSHNGLTIFPVPSSGTFTVIVSENENEVVHTVITDVAGKKVKEYYSIANTPAQVELKEGRGIYFISVSSSHGIWNDKIIVR